MRKFLVIFVMSLSLIGCSEKYLNGRVNELRQERKSLSSDVNRLKNECSSLQQRQVILFQTVRNLEAEKYALSNGREPNYVITLEIKQSTFTLDIGEHIKNNMNAITMQIPVSKQFYNSVRVGTKISEEFKYGSLVFNGDFSELNVVVKDKYVKY
jgi:ATP-dependent 26S proteasome regulatory subunit